MQRLKERIRLHLLIGESANFKIIQGVDMGQRGEINVSVIGGEPGARVSGTAHRIED